MITIRVTPAKQRFGRPRRKQWRYQIVAENGLTLSDQDTFANVGDIRDILTLLLAGTEPIQLEIHYRDETVTERIR